MSATGTRRLVGVWAALVVATLLSWLAGDHHGLDSVRLGVALALAIAFVKVRYVALDFMELRTAPPPLRWAIELWVLVVGIGLVGLYLLA